MRPYLLMTTVRSPRLLVCEQVVRRSYGEHPCLGHQHPRLGARGEHHYHRFPWKWTSLIATGFHIWGTYHELPHLGQLAYTPMYVSSINMTYLCCTSFYWTSLCSASLSCTFLCFWVVGAVRCCRGCRGAVGCCRGCRGAAGCCRGCRGAVGLPTAVGCVGCVG